MWLRCEPREQEMTNLRRPVLSLLLTSILRCAAGSELQEPALVQLY
jgi:hypothetical protein